MDDSSSGNQPFQGQESYPENEEIESSEMDGLSPYSTPPLTPMSCFYWSCSSSFGDWSENSSEESRQESIHCLDVDQNSEIEDSIEHMLEYDFTTRDIDSETLHFTGIFYDHGLHLAAETNLLASPLVTDTHSIHKVSNIVEDGNESPITLKNNPFFASSKLQNYENELKNEFNLDKLDSFKYGNSGNEYDIKDATRLATVSSLPNCEANTSFHMPPEKECFNDHAAYKYDDSLENEKIFHDSNGDQNGQSEGHIKQLLEFDIKKPNEIYTEYFRNSTTDGGSGSHLMAESNLPSRAILSGFHLATEKNLSSGPLLVRTRPIHEVSNTIEDGNDSTMILKNDSLFPSLELHVSENEPSHDKLASFNSGKAGDGSDDKGTTGLATVSFLSNCEADAGLHIPPETEDSNNNVAYSYDDNRENENTHDSNIHQNGQNEGSIKQPIEHDIKSIEIDIDHFRNITSDDGTSIFDSNNREDGHIKQLLEHDNNVAYSYDDNLENENTHDSNIDQNGQNEGYIKQPIEHDIAKSTEIDFDNFHNITSEDGSKYHPVDEKKLPSHSLPLDGTSIFDSNNGEDGHIKQPLEHDITKSTEDIDIDNFGNITRNDGSESDLVADSNIPSHALPLDGNSIVDNNNREDRSELKVELENSLQSTLSELSIDKDEFKNKLNHGNSGSFEYEETCDESDSEDDPSLESPSLLPTLETDPAIWMPPEPEDLEDEIDSVANNDDDDYYGDGTVWPQQSSLHSLNGYNDKSHKYVEDRRKAMVATMNGQFRILVRHFLISEGIISSEAEDNPSWLDIVVLLSWEAAQFIKPDASEGLAMDPSSYVKVKCVASGSPHDSQVIKGLVFKKNAAHKHMPTNLKNPKLLLLQGALGHSLVGFSSFKALEQENVHLKSITEMIENFHPDVVMVEKIVSRDVQESLLAKGITLVFDMKLHRLERIALCIGSPIISLVNFSKPPKLNQCESFHVEKIVEEHNRSEGGRKPSKTLMFLEGFPKPLGCTILLKGAHSEELKKIKHVLQYTVFAAYHLILETSFFADQKVFFPDNYGTRILSAKSSSVKYNGNDSSATTEGSETALVSQDILDCPVPISNGAANSFAQEGISLQSELTISRKFLGCDSVNSTLGNISAHQFGNAFKSDTLDCDSSIPYSAFNDKLHNNQSTKLCTLSLNNSGLVDKLNNKGNDEKPILHGEGDPGIASVCTTQDEDGMQSVLDQQSILVLQSRRCITKQVTCDESHLSRIKYYGNSDLSLERFLKDTLLNKMYKCSSCEEPSEAHVFSYTHKNGNLSVFVRQLPEGFHLTGEDEGKIWMWTRCLKCRDESKVPSTRRVMLSGSALKLSFGKFLEISFSVHSAAIRLSKCRHSLLRDNLRFFGLGSKVAMFKYSPVEIYEPCKPPTILEFHSVKGQQWLKKETERILAKSHTFFTELPKVMDGLLKDKIQISGSLKEYAEIKEILTKEKDEFEASLLKATDQNCLVRMSVSQFLGLRWLDQELLLLLYVWDRRIHDLMHNGVIKGKVDTSYHVSASTARHNAQDQQIVSAEISRDSDNNSRYPISLQGAWHAAQGSSDRSRIEKDATDMVKQGSDSKQSNLLHAESSKIGKDALGENVSGEAFRKKESDLDVKISMVDGAIENINASTEEKQKLCWASFSELRKDLKKDLYGGSLHKFDFINSYAPFYLSPVNEPSHYQTDLLHFTVGPVGTVMTASEDEISSLIACGLAFSADQQGLLDMIEKERIGIMGSVHKTASTVSDDLVLSASWSSNGSAESEGSYSVSSSSSDELPILSSDDSLSGDFFSSSNFHPEIAIGVAKVTGKRKFSVVCIYAKEFYKLRRKCCPSELAFISSLSRCRKWDAQGGKSKAFFAKTMDDRFIIKQINKTELESFLRFGPDYFKHVSLSLESGSQTCLAKIMGIYQVKQNRSGKELKLDLLVMENLMFGHNISRTYDLKGAMFSRYVAPNSDDVLLDQNFVEDMLVSPIYISGRAKHLLQRAIWNDTSFLTSVNVMDYSLLVGVDKQRHELVFGIIDYLREYTWDKQLETWVKTSIVVPKNELPTIISPKDYKKRFRKYMSKYFLTVPAKWNSEHCLINCKFCTDGKQSCVKVHNVELSKQPMEHANELD